MEELLSLKWNNHKSTFIHILGILRDKQLYTDATLACEGKFYNAHKLVLSTCSDYFSAMLDRTDCKNPVIVLKDIRSEDLEALLDYMYLGEVNVRQSDLATLIKAAECLRVKGLAVPDDEPPPRKVREQRRDNSASSPPAKRKRRSEVDDGRDDVRNVRQDNSHTAPMRSSITKPLNAYSNTEQNSNVSNIVSNNVNVVNNLDSVNNDSPTDDAQVSKSEYLQEMHNKSVDSMSEMPPVKVEVLDHENTDNGDSMAPDPSSYLDNDEFKEEDPQELSSDLPEFLQHASGSFPQGNFPGTSFQPDMWQGDGTGGNFSAAANLAFDNQNNTSTGSDEISGFLRHCRPPSSTQLGNSSEASSVILAPCVNMEEVMQFHKVSSQDGTGKELSQFYENGTHSLVEARNCVVQTSAGDSVIKGYFCKVCDKSFGNSKDCRRHTIVHSNFKPYQCPYCEHNTNLKFNLKKHVERMHLSQLKSFETSFDLNALS